MGSSSSNAFAGNPFSAASSLRRKLMVLGTIGLGLSAFGFLVDRSQFFTAYLQAYMFLLAFPLGCLGLLMIHNLTDGSWGWTIRPFLIAGIQTIPWMVVFFIPIVLGMHHLYPWTNSELVEHDPVLLAKAGYLNISFWLVRAVFYFSVWMVIGALLQRWVLSGPKQGTLEEKFRVQRLSAGGILVYMVTMSFAVFDWLMSVEPHWFSSIFGLIAIVGQGMTGFGFTTYVLILMNRKSANPWLTQRNLHDLGKFLFMTVMLWGYTNLSQYLIIWMGNLPEETVWYQLRRDGHWGMISFFLFMTQFWVAFFVLLPSRVKKNADALLKIIPCMLALRLLEQIYLVAPSLREGHAPFHWLDLVVPMGIGGIWASLFFASLGGSKGIPEPVIVPHSYHTPQDKNMPRPKQDRN